MALLTVCEETVFITQEGDRYCRFNFKETRSQRLYVGLDSFLRLLIAISVGTKNYVNSMQYTGNVVWAETGNDTEECTCTLFQTYVFLDLVQFSYIEHYQRLYVSCVKSC